MADKGVANRHFVQMRQAPELHQIVEIEIVAGVHTKTERVRKLRGPRVDGERLARGHVAALERTSERLRVQLDAICAHLRCKANRVVPRIHEQTDANAVIAQLRYRARQRVARCVRRPSRLARDFTRLDRNKRALVGLHGVRQLQEVRSWVALDVELYASFQLLQMRGDTVNVSLRDMP